MNIRSLQQSRYQGAVVVSKVILYAVQPPTFQTFFTHTKISTFTYTCPFHYVSLSAVDELLIFPVTILLSYRTHDAEKATRFIILFFLKFVFHSLFRFSCFPVRLHERGIEMTTRIGHQSAPEWGGSLEISDKLMKIATEFRSECFCHKSVVLVTGGGTRI